MPTACAFRLVALFLVLTHHEFLLTVGGSVDGRTPTLREWQRLIEKVDDLHEDLNQIHFDWTEEEER